MVRRFFWALTARFTRAMGCSYLVGKWLFRRLCCRSAVQQLLDPLGVVGRHRGPSIQPSRPLGRLVLEQVAAAGFLTHDLPGTGAPESLRRAAVGLGLGHLFRSSVPSVSVRRWFGIAGGCGLGRGTTGVLGRTSARLCPAVRCQHHRHVASVLLGRRLDESVVGDVAAQALQQPVAQLGSRLLTSAEHDGHLDFRSRFQEPDHVTLFGLVVVIVDLGSQFLFFDDGLLLVLARLARLLRRLILELAVVHDLADRWSGVRRNFDKVEIGVRGDAKGIFDTPNAYLFPSRADQTDFRYADALVDAGLSADGASLVQWLFSLPPPPGSSRVSGRDTTHQQKSPA